MVLKSTSADISTRRTRPYVWVPSNRTLMFIDAFAWMQAIILAALLRYDFDINEINWAGCVGFAFAAAALQLGIGSMIRLYGRWRSYNPGGFEEASTLTLVGAVVGTALWVITLLFGVAWGISRGQMLIATPLALLLMFAARFVERILMERSRRPGSGSTPALILGAGCVGTNLLQWMMSDPASPYRPVGLLDDDPQFNHRRIRGVPVLGPVDHMKRAVEATGAEVLIVAIADADPALLRKIQNQARRMSLAVKVMPPLKDIMDHRVSGRDLRDLSIEDLLGRQQVETNVSDIASYLSGKRVLVTGAGGSIGSQLCTEISAYGPSELIMVDRDETGLQGALINVENNGLLDTESVVLADIRDADTLLELFLNRQPEVVFHAAALKHLPMLERYPEEAWKTNVLGTLNVLEAAEKAGVETFINISTDKAANPTSVLGHSKRFAERLTAWFGMKTSKTYLSVRFGNVIGSRGSMLPTFMRLIGEGKPLTVTHPDVTRYFMTIPEACQLVLQAGGIGRVGEVLILDMGEPVSILGIAERMVEMSGKDIEIVFTGLRKGEKMHEELVGNDEHEIRPFHPLISHTQASALSPARLDRSDFYAELGKSTDIHATVRKLAQ